jgi:hypothetical protein
MQRLGAIRHKNRLRMSSDPHAGGVWMLHDCLERARQIAARTGVGRAATNDAAVFALQRRVARAFHALQLADSQLNLTLERRDAVRALDATATGQPGATLAERAHLNGMREHAGREVTARAALHRKARVRFCALLKLNPDCEPQVATLIEPPPPAPLSSLMAAVDALDDRDAAIVHTDVQDNAAPGTEAVGDHGITGAQVAGQLCEHLRYLRHLLELIEHYRDRVLVHRQECFDDARRKYVSHGTGFMFMARALDAVFAARSSLLELLAQAWLETADLRQVSGQAMARG